MNQTQIIKNGINILIVVAVCISLFQELKQSGSQNNNIIQSSSLNNSTSTQSILNEFTGPKIEGIKVYSSDKFNAPIKQILIRNKFNVEIGQYEFQGNDYYLSLLCNWGHMIMIYLLMNKYKTETNESTKKKILIGGAIAVMIWFYASGVIKPQRFSIEVQGRKQLDRDYINEKEIIDVLSVYEFQFDDLNEASTLKATQKIPIAQPKDLSSSNSIKQQHNQKPIYSEEEQIF